MALEALADPGWARGAIVADSHLRASGTGLSTATIPHGLAALTGRMCSSEPVRAEVRAVDGIFSMCGERPERSFRLTESDIIGALRHSRRAPPHRRVAEADRDGWTHTPLGARL